MLPLCQTYKSTITINTISRSGPAYKMQVVILGTKLHKDNQLQSLELPCKISY